MQLAFLRDARIASRCSVKPHPCVVVQPAAGSAPLPAPPPASAGGAPAQADGQQHPLQATFPPCGVLLPQGSVLLAGPLCFMYDEPAAVYRMHRALYCRCAQRGSVWRTAPLASSRDRRCGPAENACCCCALRGPQVEAVQGASFGSCRAGSPGWRTP